MRSFNPISAYSDKKSNRLEFTLEPLSGWVMYAIQESYLVVRCRLCQPDGSPVETGKFVSVQNDFVNSLFESVSLKLDSVSVNQNPEHYNYKSYAYNTLNYGNEAKVTNKCYAKLNLLTRLLILPQVSSLGAQNYFPDDAGGCGCVGMAKLPFYQTILKHAYSILSKIW